MNYQKNQEIDSIFYKLNLQDKFTSCLSSWTKALCPYTNEELHNLCYNRTSKISNELNYSHNHFLASYDELTLNEKETLKSWLLENLLKKSWKSGFGIRPEWTWNNFFKAKKEGASYLDVGPCHGVHSNLIYKEYYKGNYEYHAVDILPAYLQLQTFFGIKTKYFDANKMSLCDLYDSKSMDLTLFSEVLEHLSQEDGEKIIVDLSIIMKKKGKLLLSFPVDASPFNQEPFGHVYQPSVENILTLLEKVGFHNHEYTKLWSGKTHQHVIICEKK
jgi:SAM-dependent methyltransferase